MTHHKVKMLMSRLTLCSALAVVGLDVTLIGRPTSARAAAGAGELGRDGSSVAPVDFPSSLALRIEASKALDGVGARGKQEKTAEETYKNIQIFKGVPASRIMGAMQFLTKSLGVDCTYCHVQGEFDKDDKPAKQTARKMYQMVRLASSEISSNQVSCYMCHRGHPKPEPKAQTDAEKAKFAEMIKKAQEDKRPAGEVFKNIQYLKATPAGMFMLVMNRWADMLGVDCSHCHVEGAFEKDDKPAKQTARKMARMIGAITENLYKLPTPMNCYMCHKGQLKPVAFPPAAPK